MSSLAPNSLKTWYRASMCLLLDGFHGVSAKSVAPFLSSRTSKAGQSEYQYPSRILGVLDLSVTASNIYLGRGYGDTRRRIGEPRHERTIAANSNTQKRLSAFRSTGVLLVQSCRTILRSRFLCDGRLSGCAGITLCNGRELRGTKGQPPNDSSRLCRALRRT